MVEYWTLVIGGIFLKPCTAVAVAVYLCLTSYQLRCALPRLHHTSAISCNLAGLDLSMVSLAFFSERRAELNSTMADPRARGGEEVRGRGGGGMRGRGGGVSGEGEVRGEGGVGRGVRDSDRDQGRGGGGQDLHKCRSCGEACGTTIALYRHVAIRCLGQLGETMKEFRRKFQLQQHRARYQQRPEERRAQVRGKVCLSPHIILGTFGQSSSILW